MEHRFTGEECLVPHYDDEGNNLPQCKRCGVCGKNIPYPYDKNCEEKK